MSQGRIVEQGTYAELIANEKGPFAKFVKEFNKGEGEEDIEESKAKLASEVIDQTKMSSTSAGAVLMQEEERLIGSVSNDIYFSYFKAGKGL